MWRPLAGIIEERWRQRFGEKELDKARKSLQALVGRFDLELPHYLPVAGVRKRDQEWKIGPYPAGDRTADLDLSVLLSQALLMFTIDFERESRLSLSISANALRLLNEKGVRLRDLPSLTGVSKEAISVSVKFLERHGCLLVEADPTASRAKLARLTPKGLNAQEKYRRILGAVEEQWSARFGEGTILGLRQALEALVDQTEDGRPRISEGLVPNPDGWRAARPYLKQTNAVIRDPGGSLPHFPMVSHRGGYPDGS